MPTFDYSGEVTKRFGKTTVLAGERFEHDEYISDSDCNLVSHLPTVDTQTENFFSDDIVAGVVSEVTVNPRFPRIVTYNICGGICRVYPNDDTANAIVMANNTFWTFDNRDQKIGTLNLSGEASGRIDVNGDMNTIGS